MELPTRTCLACRVGVSVRVAEMPEGEAWRCLNCYAYETIGRDDERSTLASIPEGADVEPAEAAAGEPESPPPFETSPTIEPGE